MDDIVADILSAAKLSLDVSGGNTPFEIFSLGNSHPVKLSELVKLLEAAPGRRSFCQHWPPQPGDVPLTWVDVSKAQRILGYRPSSRIEEGLRRLVEGYIELLRRRVEWMHFIE